MPIRCGSVGMSRPGFRGDGVCRFLSSFDGDCWLCFHSVGFLDLSGWPVSEGFVQAGVVEPGDVADDRDLELAATGPGSVGDALGLERVDEALGGRVVVGVTDGSD